MHSAVSHKTPSILTVIYSRYRPAPEDHLLKAFQVLDTEGKGYLLQEELQKYITEEGKILYI